MPHKAIALSVAQDRLCVEQGNGGRALDMGLPGDLLRNLGKVWLENDKTLRVQLSAIDKPLRL